MARRIDGLVIYWGLTPGGEASDAMRCGGVWAEKPERSKE
jgi:hypothetical protein